MNTLITGFNLIMILLIGLLYVFTPKLLNRYLLFGVTVNDDILRDESTEGIKKQYRILTLAVCFLSLTVYAGLYLILNKTSASTVFIVVLAAELVVDDLIYFHAHYRIKSVKRRLNIPVSGIKTIDTREVQEFSVINPLLYLVYFLLIGGVVFLSLQKYPDLPEKIATHFNADGIPNGFMHKSWKALLSLPAMMFLFSLLFMGINTALKRAKKVSGTAKGKLSFSQENRFRYLWSIALYLSGILILAILSAAQFTIIQIIPDRTYIVPISLGGSLLMILMILGLTVYTGQSGSRLKQSKKETDIVDRDDDAFWKGGIIYVNRKDPSVFVNKRFGIGFTVNFGHPLSWIIIAALIGFIVYSLV